MLPKLELSPRAAHFWAWLSLFVLVSTPVWLSGDFTNPDGSAHTYSSRVIWEIWSGDELFRSVFTTQRVLMPNSAGHYLLAILQVAVDAGTANRLMLTLTFASLSGAIVWLRIRVAGPGGAVVTALFAAAVSINIFWAVGTYNFVIGLAACLVGLSLFHRWRDELTVWRVASIAILLVITYFFHLVSFGMLLMCLAVSAVTASSRRKAIAAVAIAALPTIPLLISYWGLVRTDGVPMSPSWTVDHSFSARQLLPPDIFSLIDRRRFPFTDSESVFNAVFSPILYIGAALLLLWKWPTRADLRRANEKLAFLIILAAAAVFTIAGPDNLGVRNGALLRDRMLLLGVSLGISVLTFGVPRWRRAAAMVCVTYVCAFQTAMLYDYGRRIDATMDKYTAAAAAVPDGSAVAEVTIVARRPRFYFIPHSQATSYVFAGRRVIVWDNYEWGNYYFPAQPASEEDRRFATDLARSSVLDHTGPTSMYEEKLITLRRLFATGKIDYLFVYGEDPRFDSITADYFDPAPMNDDPELRLLKRKQ